MPRPARRAPARAGAAAPHRRQRSLDTGGGNHGDRNIDRPTARRRTHARARPHVAQAHAGQGLPRRVPQRVVAQGGLALSASLECRGRWRPRSPSRRAPASQARFAGRVAAAYVAVHAREPALPERLPALVDVARLLVEARRERIAMLVEGERVAMLATRLPRTWPCSGWRAIAAPACRPIPTVSQTPTQCTDARAPAGR